MDSQCIKNTLDKDIVCSIIKEICIKETKNNCDVYMFNNSIYKRLMLFKKIEPIIDKIKYHYYESKRFYVTRKMSYKTFCTILRQLAKYVKVKIESDIKYIHSTYMIEYKVYMDE